MRTVDGVKLVGVEPVRGPEHGEEKHDEWLKLEGLEIFCDKPTAVAERNLSSSHDR